MTYREVLRPPPVYWALVPLAAFFAAAALFPVDRPLAGLGALLGGAATAYGLQRAAVVVEVEGTHVRAGGAVLPASAVAAVEALDEGRTRHALGPGLDARAFLCTRPWARRAVRIDLADPEDPAPYWLVSSGRPEALAEALLAARARSFGT